MSIKKKQLIKALMTIIHILIDDSKITFRISDKVKTDKYLKNSTFSAIWDNICKK